LAVVDRTKFVRSPGIELTIWDQPPFGALERDLVKFGYVEPDFAYDIPAFLLSLATLLVGVAALLAVEPEVGKEMIFAGLSALIGNALPRPIMTFTGNLGELVCSRAFSLQQRIVYEM
jgi:hypothetical protein